MIRLSSRDLGVCSEAVRALYADFCLEAFPERALATVSRLVSVEHITYNQLTLQPRKLLVKFLPERPDAELLIPQLAAHFNTHPLAKFIHSTEPRRIVDVTSFRQFKETAVFREYYGCIGVTNQMVFALENTGVLIALNRRERGFSDRDQAVISFLSPHISQAYQNARARAELSADIGEIGKGLAAIERAIIFADRGGRIVWLTALAREWLLELFPGSIKSGMRLPPPFAARVSAFEQSQSKKSFFETHLAAGPEQQLTARFIRTSLGKFLIVLDRERAAIAGAVANSLGLTRREGEILYWISEAKADREIAVLLGVSPRTVHKHVEHLFAKVGVDNRAAAQRLGWDLRRI